MLLFVSAGLATTGSFGVDPGSASSLECVLREEPSLDATRTAAADFQRLVTFEGIRTEHGGQWPKDVWSGAFNDFNTEIKAVLAPIQSREISTQSQRLRRALPERFSALELKQICDTLRDPYYAELKARAARNDKVLNDGIQAYATGRLASDQAKKDLLSMMAAGENDLRSFQSENKERAKQLTSTPAFGKYSALAQEEARRTAERITRATQSNAELRTILANWNSLARRGPLGKGK